MPDIFSRWRVTRSSQFPIKITAICDGLIPSVELCVIQPLKYLTELHKIQHKIYFEGETLPVEDMKDSDIVLVMRSCTTETLLAVQSLYKNSKIIFMADDNIIAALDEFPPENAIRRHYEHLNARHNFPALMGYSDVVVVFSQAMREDFQSIAKRIVVAPAISGIELSGIENIDVGLARPGTELRLGYAGSSTHQHDVALLGNSLPSLLQEIPNLFVESIDQRLDNLSGHPRYRHLEAVKGLGQFFHLLHSRNWSLGLSPLCENRFNRSKTDNKFRSYASLGIPGVYSNRAPFAGSVRHLKTGILANDTPEDWYNAVYNLIGDPTLRRRIANKALMDIRDRYSLPVVSRFYERLFSSLVNPSRRPTEI